MPSVRNGTKIKKEKRRKEMKQKWKRITAVMLVIIMVLGMAPDAAVTVHAEETAVTEQGANDREEGTPGITIEEKVTEETTEADMGPEDETARETAPEENTDSLPKEKTAVEAEKTTEATEDAGVSDVQETPDTADTEPEEEQGEFRTVEEYILYCSQSTSVYQMADTDSIVLEELAAGECFTVTAESDAWYRIAYGTEEKTGYVEKKEGCFTREPAEETIMPVMMEEEMVSPQAASNSKMIYSDGTWSGGIIWYVNPTDKHYIFCLNKGATMYSGKYSGSLTTGYSGYEAFRISTALNYFKSKNGGWGGKKDYGMVQQVIWNTGSSDLLTYIKHAWKLADNNSSRSPGSSSYDSKLKAVTGVTSKPGIKKAAESLTAQKVSNTDGVISKTISLSGSAWKYFAKESFGSGISVMGIYDKDGNAVSYDKDANYVGTDGKLHIRVATDSSTGFGGIDNPATIIMKVKFPYQGADKFRYLLTPSGKQNLTYDASADTSAYFAIKVYTKSSEEYPELSINKVDEFGNELSGCTFQVKGTSGDALTNVYENEQVINSTDDVFEIKYAGTYSIQETAVPANGEYELNTNVVTFTAEWETDANGVNKLVLKKPLVVDVTQAGNYNWDESQNRLTYTFTNRHAEGTAVLKKYGSMLVSWKDGKFVYEKKTLSGAGFAFYADEDIYCGDKLVYEEGDRIYRGTLWGGLSHQITINGNTAADFFNGTYETDSNGEITISGLPAGEYYAVETGTPDGFEDTSMPVHFTIVPGQTVKINGAEGIVNEVAPAVCHVFKVDEDTDQALNGGEFTLYADVANTNFYGESLFNTSDTVPAVTARNLATGAVTVEEGRWVPIQTVTTTDGGMAEFDDLPRGRYLVVETKAPVTEDGRPYQLAEESYIFVHDGETNASANGFNFEHTFRDILSKNYQIVKHVETAQKADEGNKDVYVFSNEPASGAVFGIYAAEDIYNTTGKQAWKAGQQIAAVTTNGEGIAAYSGVLYSGSYYFKEIKTPDDERYILDTTEYPFTVGADNPGGLLTEEPLINKQYKGSIKVIKTDGRTEVPLSDVEFTLMDGEKKELGTFVTDENGEIHIERLPVGTYYLQETKTKEGYKLDDTVKEVTISKDDLDQVVEFENYNNETFISVKTNTTIRGIGAVRTGDTALIGFILALFLLSSAGVLYFGRKRGFQIRKLPVKGKRFILVLTLTAGLLALGSLTVKAAAELGEISAVELKDVEHNGTVYTYALQKQYETSDPDEKITFEEELDGNLKLDDVTYETVDTIFQTKVLEETRDYKELMEKDESKLPKAVDVDGQTYNLDHITWEEKPNTEHVSYTQDYGYAVSEPAHPETYEYTYTSSVTGEENTVTLPFVRMEKGEYSWVDGFTATVTFQNLDGVYFKLGSHEFAYNADKLSLTESDYKELVKMLGYDTSKCRLTSASWSGKAYKGKNGQMYRDAKASGQQYAASYKAVYEDDVENGKLYTAHVVYTCEVEASAEEAPPTYVIQATGYYEKAGVWKNIITFVTEHKAVSAISAGIVLLFSILVIVLFVTSRKRKRDLDAGGGDA